MKKFSEIDPKTKKTCSILFLVAAIFSIIAGIINSTKGNGIDYTSFTIACSSVCVSALFSIKDKDNK